MIVICPKCQFENKAETTHVICARCATLIEVKTLQGAAGNWGATDLAQRVTKPMSSTPLAAPAPGNGAPRRDLFATRVEPDADEVLDIPRVSNGIYPMSESGAIFDDVLSAPGGTVPTADYSEMPLPEKLSASPAENLNQYPPVSPVAPTVFSPPVFSIPAASTTAPPVFPDPTV